MTRKEVLEHAIRLDMPFDQLNEAFRSIDWDCEEPVVNLRRADLSAIVDRFLLGELSAEDVDHWANLLESREDIGFLPEDEGVVKEMIFWLANPQMNLPRGILDQDVAVVIREKLNA